MLQPPRKRLRLGEEISTELLDDSVIIVMSRSETGYRVVATDQFGRTLTGTARNYGPGKLEERFANEYVRTLFNTYYTGGSYRWTRRVPGEELESSALVQSPVSETAQLRLAI